MAYTAKKILITGASGFIGSFLVEQALAEGYEVWAAVRSTTSRRYLQDERIRFVELDLGHEERLKAQLEAHVAHEGAWQYVIHAAGATKCHSRQDRPHKRIPRVHEARLQEHGARRNEAQQQGLQEPKRAG